MSFWDELRGNIVQGSREALKKTQEIADVVSMNAGISDSKRKIRELYEELGELVAKEAFSETTQEQIRSILEDEKAQDTPHEIVIRNWKEIYSVVRYIKSEEEVIRLNESKISEIRTEMKCPGCGSRIMKGMAYCPECGMKLTKPEAGQEAPSGAEAKEPEAGESEVKKPETKRPEAGEPETKEPETQEPGSGEPETKEPETQEPETKASDTEAH